MRVVLIGKFDFDVISLSLSLGDIILFRFLFYLFRLFDNDDNSDKWRFLILSSNNFFFFLQNGIMDNLEIVLNVNRKRWINI